MTPRTTSRPLSAILSRLHAAHRRAMALRVSLRAAAEAAIVIVIAVLAGMWLVRSEASAWVRLAIVLAALAAVIVRALWVFRSRSPGFEALLERCEERFPDVRSWLRNALDFEQAPPEHTSPELAQAVTQETAQRLTRVPLETTTPRIEPRRPLAVLAGAFLGVVVLALVSPQGTMGSWASLLDPPSAAPPVRIEVEPGSVKVTPGAALTVRARVWGTTRRPEIERRGEPEVTAAPEGAAEGGAHLWRFDLAQLTRDQSYRVRVARVTSPEYRIALAGEPSAVSFDIEYQSPAYARLPVQRGAATRGDLSALTGTRARIVATFDRDLASLDARLPGRAPVRWTAITPRRWSGEIPIVADGEYELDARAESGATRFRYRMTALPDAPPVIAVNVPTGDLDLPAGQQVPVELLAQDDLGLSKLQLQYRKDPEAPWRNVPLANFAARPREAAVRSRWDASGLGLLPGQTATFRFEVEDNNVLTGPGRAVSATFELRFPGLAELYENIDHDQGSVRQELEKAAQQAREVQKSLDQLARQQPQQRAAPQNSNSFERSEEMKSALQRQQDLGQKIDQAAQQLQQTLEQASERQAFNEDLMRKLREMSELIRQIQSPEFREALKRMQEALERMDRQQLEQALPEWRDQNRDMVKQLQRTIDLLKQLRQEEQLAALAQRARELKNQQDALNREHGETPPKDAQSKSESLAEKQQQAAEKTDQLANEAKQLATEADQPQDRDQIQQAAEEMQQNATPQQRDASKSARSQQRRQAKQQGEKASESLEKASEALEQMVAESQKRRQEVDPAAVRRAAKDLVSLQRESESNLTAPSSPERSDRQTDLSDGVSRVADSLGVLAMQQPFITPQLGEALGRAIESLSESGRQMSTGNPARGEMAGREGSSALNQAIKELRVSENKMCQGGQGQGGSKRSGRAGEMMSEYGKRQSQINQETRDVSQRLSQQMRLSSGDQAQLRQLADQQRRLREQLEQMQRDEELKRELLGRLDQAQKEMKEVEEVLERGATDGELQEKQERILSRLLDAQRSVNRRDFDPQRESRPGEDVAQASPSELPADLMRESDRLRLDLLKADSDRYPAQYRAYIEAYLRSLNQQRATPRR